MRSLLVALALSAVACGPKPPPKALPADLPPPEYETPRGYDLDGGKGKQPEAPPAPPAPTAPAPPKN